MEEGGTNFHGGGGLADCGLRFGVAEIDDEEFIFRSVEEVEIRSAADSGPARRRTGCARSLGRQRPPYHLGRFSKRLCETHTCRRDPTIRGTIRGDVDAGQAICSEGERSILRGDHSQVMKCVAGLFFDDLSHLAVSIS
jgi:hypothetical protein